MIGEQVVERNDPNTLFVSVIVIVLNGERNIDNCIKSLIKQTYPSDFYEIIVVDNGSSDSTVDRAKKFPVRIAYEPIQGIPMARNHGIKLAQGSIIAFTDSDCIADPNWLKRLIAPYRNPEIGIVGGSIHNITSEKENIIERFFLTTNFIAPPRQFRDSSYSYFTTANVSYRKDAIMKAGYFDVRLKRCSDVDLSRKVQLNIGLKAAFVENSIIFHSHPRHLKELIRFTRNNGYGEILMAIQWKNQENFKTNLGRELLYLFRQIITLGRYLASFFFRLVKSLFVTDKVFFVVYPLLWFVAESATIFGKIRALYDTRLMKYLPDKHELT